MSELSAVESRSTGLRRLVTLYATIAVAFAILTGSITTVEFASGLAKFGGLEYVGRLTALSGVRVLVPPVH
jgi:ABC-type transporter Mla maintaining outer membrane lipid asymmetry permease subunit MlaE